MNENMDYDSIIFRAAPNYSVALDIFSKIIPSNTKKIISLGTGTGNLEKNILSSFPEIEILGYDINDKYINQAIQKLQGYNFKGFNKDVKEVYQFSKSDHFISALTFHHLEHELKIETWEKIYSSLDKNGRFINYDIVKSNSEEEHNEFVNYVVSNMRANNLPEDFIKDEIRILNGIGEDADKPLTYEHQKSILEKLGFKVEQNWSDKSFMIYTAIKT